MLHFALPEISLRQGLTARLEVPVWISKNKIRRRRRPLKGLIGNSAQNVVAFPFNPFKGTTTNPGS